MDQAEPVQATTGELATRRVEREDAVTGDGAAALNEGPALTPPAEPERLEPDDGEHGEPVVELRRVDVGRGQLGALPHGRRRVAGRHGGHVVELVPARSAAQCRAERVDLDGRVVQVVGDVAVRHDDGGRPVARRIAVEEAQRRRDDARRQVVVERQGIGVDRLGVQRGVAATVDGDLTQLLAGQPELVHATLPDHGDPVGGRHCAEGERPLHEAPEAGHAATATSTATAGSADALPAPGALGGALGDGPVDQDVAGQAGRHRERRRHDGAHLRRPLATAVVPVQRQAEGVLDLWRRRAAEARRAGAHARVGGEAVDVVTAEPGIGNGGQRRLHRQVEVGAAQASAHGGLPDARDDGASLQRLLDRCRAHDVPSGVKSGSQTSSACSNTTRTGMPIRTSSGSMSIRFVVSRTSGCSSIDTQAMM